MDIVLRATVMFLFLFVLLRLMGKRELGEMTPFDFVMLVVMGDLIQQGVTHNDFSLTGGILAVTTMAFWAMVLSFFVNKSKRAEKLIEGEPAVIIRDGAILEENLKRNRMTKDELDSEMRLVGIAHMSQVAWGILETNGKVSFIRADGKPPPDPPKE